MNTIINFIQDISAKAIPSNMTAIISATIMVSDAKRLQDIFNALRSVTGVFEITRIIH